MDRGAERRRLVEAMRSARARGDTAAFVAARARLEEASRLAVLLDYMPSQRDLAGAVGSFAHGDWEPSFGVAAPRWNEKLHPRDRLGKFARVLTSLKRSTQSGRQHVVVLPSGHYVTHKYGRYRLHAKGGGLLFKSSDPEAVARHVVGHVRFPRAKFEYDTSPPVRPSLRARRAGGF